MRLSPALPILLALVAGACGDRHSRVLSHRGFEPGMSAAAFRQAAESIGPLDCQPFRVEDVAADQLCSATSTTSGLHVVAALRMAGGPVPYVVVQEPDSGNGFAMLTRAWGAPDTLVETGRRWHHGRWLADADTADGHLSVWLTDTATALGIARHTLALERAVRDTMPVENVLSAVLDTIQATSPPGAAIPASAAEVDAPPKVLACRQAVVPEALAGVEGEAVLMYVVDTAGQVEPASIRALRATRAAFIPPAVRMIGSCRLRPGRQGGHPVRVLVQQRVGFHKK